MARFILNKLKICCRQNILFKLLSICCLCIMFMTIFFYMTTTNNQRINMKKCFRHKSVVETEANHAIIFLDDIMQAKKRPQKGRSIFFHETTCSENGLVRLNARQACAIESAAKANPNWDIFLLFASPVGFVNVSKPHDPILQALESYSNINLRNVNLWTYAYSTPIEQWIIDEELFYSQYVNSHASDFLRYLSMYKFGGVYLDLDVVVQKTFENLEPNFSGAESSEFIAAGVMSFDYKDYGHEVAKLCLNDFQRNFNGDDWGTNGPGVITRVLQQLCGTKTPELMTRERCGGFKAYPPGEFYAVPWPNWDWFFDPTKTNETLELTKNSQVVHVWNKHSIKKKVKVGSSVAYGLIAEKHCPNVYKASGDYF